MSYKPTNPETRQIAGPPINKELDTIRIDRLQIDPSHNPTVLPTGRVYVVEGYMDGETFIGVDTKEVLYGPSNFPVELQTIIGPLYGPVQQGAWDLLVATSQVPPGSVE